MKQFKSHFLTFLTSFFRILSLFDFVDVKEFVNNGLMITPFFAWKNRKLMIVYVDANKLFCMPWLLC